MATHSRTFRLTDKAVQILDSQTNKTQFVIDAILETQVVADGYMRCYSCKGAFELVCFGKDKTRPSGHESICRNCKAIKNNK